MSRLSTVALAVALLAASVAADKYCLRQAGDTFTVEHRDCTPLPTDLVEAEYNRTYTATGWDGISISPLKMASIGRTKSLYYAGYLEGYITPDSIWNTYLNTIAPIAITPAMNAWIEAHRKYMRDQSSNVAAGAKHANFWSMVGDLLQQIKGLSDGYNAAQSDPAKQLNETQMFWMSYNPEFGDVAVFTVPGYQWQSPVTPAIGHCSALIRNTGSDLFMAHDTWSSFNGMLRQFKVYNFETTVAMSGYPGVIHSIDDWYMTSNQLTVQETTNLMYNYSIYEYCSNQTVSEFLRVMTANYLATSSPQWIELVSTENSGTYNNQWMAVDMKLYQPGQPIQSDTLWIYEQLPGPLARSMDVSDVLQKQGYWISYNLPYIPEVYEVSGNEYMKEQYGSYYSYTKYARPQIFHRQAPLVQNLDDMKTLMRWNDYKNDSASLIPNCTSATKGKCDPAYSSMLAIASRGDLDPISDVAHMGILYALAQVGQQNLGAIDSKITSYTMTLDPKNLRGHIVCGPTQSHGLPAFQWSTAPAATFAGVPHNGQVDRFDFDWQAVTASPAIIRHPVNSGQSAAIAIVIVLSVIMVGIFAVIFVRMHVLKPSKDGEKQNLV